MAIEKLRTAFPGGLTTNTAARIALRVAGLLPWFFVALFLLFVLAFLVAPTIVLVLQAFTGAHGFTFSYMAGLLDFQYRLAFENSILLAFASASVGLIFGALLANALAAPGAPKFLRGFVTSFSAVAANFSGVPL